MRRDKARESAAAAVAASRQEPAAPFGPTVMVAGGVVAPALAHAGAGTNGEVPLTPVGKLGDVADADRYLSRGVIGEGGMGQVGMVLDRVLGRTVAQKRVLERPHDAFLLSEAQICAQLEHPAIVPVYDAGCDAEGRPFYTMRLVDGRPLSELLELERTGAGGLGLSRLLGILRQVCLAVDYAHSRGVVHRDLKPDNVVAGAFGEVYVLDWGVACVGEHSDVRQAVALPGAEAVAGTPGYMAPEQALGRPIGPATDVFALGVMLHEILTGELPYEDADLHSVVRRAKRRGSAPPPSLAGEQPRIGPPFVELVRACLRRDPARRPDSARIIADAIDRHLDQRRVRAEQQQRADERVTEGRRALAAGKRLGQQAGRLAGQASAMLAQLEPCSPAQAKRPAWQLAERGRRLRAQAAAELAAAETAFAGALGHVSDHRPARMELAALHYAGMLEAEREGDTERGAGERELARSYDDGALGLELADEGELVVEIEPETAALMLERYEPLGPLLEPVAVEGSLRTGQTRRLPAGSYRVTASLGEQILRYPLLVHRARRHRLRLRLPPTRSLPEGMIHVPAGPFLARSVSDGERAERLLPDFAIGQFPVTYERYVAFLDALPDSDRSIRVPGRVGVPLLMREEDGSWGGTDALVEGDGRKRVPASERMRIPVFEVTWYAAAAYARWLARETGLPYRLPAALEWEKAMRGADGRMFPMGNELDPAFAKLRQSRPEATQPEPAGAFALDVSPCGVRDLAGGVCDWTATFVDGLAPPGPDEEGRPESDERQAIYRGRHWGSVPGPGVKSFAMPIRHRSSAVGLRLALDLPGEPSAELQIEPMAR